MGELQKWIGRITLTALAVFWASVVCVNFLIRTIRNPKGPYFWQKKRRDTPPKCLSDPMYGTHKYIQLSEVKIHYVEKGDNSKPLMLFVHGFPEFWYSWRYQIKEFSKDYWTVALDMRGYGDSEKKTDIKNYTLDRLINDLKELIEALGRKKCILVAHDWGGAVAWRFIITYPEMIEKYVIMDAPHPDGFRKLMHKNSKQFFMSWYIFFFQLPWLPERWISSYDMAGFKMMFITKDSKSTAVTDEDIEAYKYTFGKSGAFTPPINYYRAMFRFKPIFEKSGQSDEINKLPGLMLTAENDAFLSRDILVLAKQSVPSLQTEIIKDANHFVQQDAPETVNEVMRRFLKK